MEERQENQEANKPLRNELGQLLPGQTANPSGRPRGTTLKEFARAWYAQMSESEKIAYVQKVEEKRPGFAWSMAEGNPHQSVENAITGGLSIQFAKDFDKEVKPQ